jgi:parallel beta-helix repeat protein
LRNVGIILVGVVALSLLVGVVSATTWTVDDSGSADFTRIQDAINASNPGDTLEVRSGTYYENVNIDKQLTLIGVDTSGGMPVVDGESGNAIIFSAEGITLDGFEVINKGSLSCVTLYYSSNNMIVNNIVFTVGNGYCGFWLYNSNNNMFINNKISNMGTGIYLDDYSNNNTLIDNTASSNMDGIHLGHYSNSNTLINNNLKYNSDYGIWLEYSSNNIIADNYVSDNGYTGIKFTSSNNNKLTNNIVSNNWESIWFCYSDNNMLINNVISNSNTGIGISRSSNNEIYLNNFMDNIENAYDNDNNQWDNGTIGNHYSNFDEPCESCIDADGDGICDSSYPIPGGGSGEDRFPLVSWSTPSENQAPVITSITPDPPEVGTGRSSTITIIASDPDGDTLSYSYIPTDGEISGSGSVVTWTAPPIAGTYRVDVTVSDGEKSASDSVFFYRG